MKIDGLALLEHLREVRWNVAARTFGNNHATLIGLVVDWWVSTAGAEHWAIEGGPGNGYAARGARGQCDAMLCDGRGPAGVLEVEGYRYLLTARKLGSFFAAKYQELRSLRFGILILYTYTPVKRGLERRLPPAAHPPSVARLRAISKQYPDKALVLVTLDKEYILQHSGIRARSEYYFGEPSKIAGQVFVGGKRKATVTFYSRNAS